MNAKIEAKTVVVVGGSRGIGLEWVSRLLGQGNTVVATARDPAACAGLQALASGEAGARLIVTQLDVTSAESVAAWAAALPGRISHIDLLIYNSGVLLEPMSARLADVTPAVLADTFSTNAFGPLLVTQQLVKQELLGGQAPSLALYTTSSVGSVSELPHAEHFALYAYRASKAALNTIVRTMAVELGPRQVTTVLLHPGYVATSMTNDGAVQPGALSPAESVGAMLGLLEGEAPIAGRYLAWDGTELGW